MKILHVCDWYRPFGGAERLLLGTLELLESAGHQNIIITSDHPSQMRTGKRLEYFLSNLEINFALLPRWRIFARNMKQLQKNIEAIIQEHKPDIIHIHNLQNPYVIQILTPLAPTVRSVHDPRLYCFTNWRLLPNGEICPHPLGRACLKEKCLSWNFLRLSNTEKWAPFKLFHLRENKKIDLLIAESHAVEACLRQNGFSDSQITLLPNYTEKKGDWHQIEAFNRRYHVPGQRVVVFVGRASYEKGIEPLVEAMALIPRPWKLILVTGGEYLGRVREKIKALNLEDAVEIPGVHDYETTRTYYARSDVVVVPSVWMESFCLVGLEAMANGKPVVAFRAGGIPDWLIDNETGFLAPVRDVKALAGKIQTLLDNEQLAREMGRRGYERAAKVFSKEQYLSALEEIFQKAIHRKNKNCKTNPV